MAAQAPDEEVEMQEIDDEDEEDEEELDEESFDEAVQETASGASAGDQDTEEHCDEPPSAAVSQAGVLDADDLEVSLAFNLGHGVVSIADLRTLAPGYVFGLESEPGAEVAIVAGGREIGRGEIVQIADRLGVRIISLQGGSDA